MFHFKYYFCLRFLRKACLFCCRRWTRTTGPVLYVAMLSQHIKHTLPTELHGTPCIYRSITEAVLTVLPCRASLSLQLCLNVSFIMLRLCRNHSAFNSHNFPRTYTTTYPYVAAPPQPNALTRKAQGFGNYRSRLLSFLWPYFTALFHAVFFLATRD